MMEAARISETSVDIQLRTRQYIAEDSELHTRRCENFKSHIQKVRHEMSMFYRFLLWSTIINHYVILFVTSEQRKLRAVWAIQWFSMVGFPGKKAQYI
jgi:hypothetical protein